MLKELALKSSHKDFPDIEGDLSQDVDTLRIYLGTIGTADSN